MKILVDTNVLLRAADSEHQDSKLSRTSIAKAIERGDTPCLAAQNIYEFWVACTRPRGVNGMGMSTVEASDRLKELHSTFEILGEEHGGTFPAMLQVWESLVREYDVQGKAAHDARLVAAMLVHRISHILTFNRNHFARYESITVLSPSTNERIA